MGFWKGLLSHAPELMSFVRNFYVQVGRPKGSTDAS